MRDFLIWWEAYKMAHKTSFIFVWLYCMMRTCIGVLFIILVGFIITTIAAAYGKFAALLFVIGIIVTGFTTLIAYMIWADIKTEEYRESLYGKDKRNG